MRFVTAFLLAVMFSCQTASPLLAITPPTAKVMDHGKEAFVATMVKGSTTTNVTQQATWSSSNPAVATVGTGGIVQGVSSGTATITATSNGLTAKAIVQVCAPLSVQAVDQNGNIITPDSVDPDGTPHYHVQTSNGLQLQATGGCQ